MRLLDPVFGYPFAPEGIAHLDLDCAGEAGEFRTDGSVHIENGSYIGTGVVATGIRLDAHVHADPARLLIASIVVRLRQGGQISGTVDLSPWLVPVPGAAVLQASGPSPTQAASSRNNPTLRPPPPFIPVNGKVTAQLKDVALDTVLDMVSQPPFQRLGFDTLLNGPATAAWSKGDTRTVSVSAALNLDPSTHLITGEAPRDWNRGRDLHPAQRRRRSAQTGIEPARQPVAGARQSGRISAHQPLGHRTRFPFPQPGRVRHRAPQPRPRAQRQIRNRCVARDLDRPGRLQRNLGRLAYQSAHRRQTERNPTCSRDAFRAANPQCSARPLPACPFRFHRDRRHLLSRAHFRRPRLPDSRQHKDLFQRSSRSHSRRQNVQ